MSETYAAPKEFYCEQEAMWSSTACSCCECGPVRDREPLATVKDSLTVQPTGMALGELCPRCECTMDNDIESVTMEHADDQVRRIHEKTGDCNRALKRAVQHLAERCAVAERERDRAVERGGEAVAGRIGIKDLQIVDGKMELKLATEMAVFFVAQMRTLLDEACERPAVNYVAMSVKDPETREAFEMVVQRADKPTPHQMRQVVEAENEQLTAQLTAQRARVALVETSLDAIVDDETDADIVFDLLAQLQAKLRNGA